jgi:t-SNARE complex subunit (syntaxin)
MLSQEELQTAKEELREAHEIAKEAVIVRELFQEVGTIIHDQGKGIAEIEKKVDTIKIEIGQGVSELEQAVRLQYEARQKYICMVLTFLIILAIIIVPIVLTFI